MTDLRLVRQVTASQQQNTGDNSESHDLAIDSVVVRQPICLLPGMV